MPTSTRASADAVRLVGRVPRPAPSPHGSQPPDHVRPARRSPRSPARIDKPFVDAAGRLLENFTRVETFGNNPDNGTDDVQWVKAIVEPRSREVFSYRPMIVPGNRTAVPAP